MTKIIAGKCGWVYIVIVLDWYTKKVVGHYIGERSKTTDWRSALDMAVSRQFPEGVHGRGLNLMSDNGCQPTSVAFMEACSAMGVHQAFTSYNNPKGNADTERMMRTIKEELLWLREWSSAAELKAELIEWFREYNSGYLHSSLGYRTPEWFETEHKNSRGTLLLSA
jgi:transposase InsO family protein